VGRPLFREEALRAHTRGREMGDVVRRPPRRTRVAYPIVVGIAALGVAGLVLGRASHDARGPAVVRAEGADGGGGYTVEAFLPAALRGELKTGSPLRIEITAYPGATVDAPIAQLDDRVLTPEEARRSMGPAADGAGLDLRGSVVVARAALPGTTFRSGGGELPYSDGMAAAATTPVRSEPLIFALFPGLRAAISH
jgi:hypothetical protein